MPPSLLEVAVRAFTGRWIRRPCVRLVVLTTLTTLLQQRAALSAHAQDIRPSSGASGTTSWVHESWTVKDGLPVNSINSLLQDRRGYIWLATFDGLVRFDGLRFTVFNTTNSEELPSNRIVGLRQARDGSLWLTTEQGHVVRYSDGRFRRIPFDGGQRSGNLAHLSEDSTGRMWAGTSEGLWAVEDDTLRRVGRDVLDERITSMAPRRDGTVWVGTETGDVFRAGVDRNLTRMADAAVFDRDFLAVMVEDPNGTLWVGSIHAVWSWRERPVRVKGIGSPSVAHQLGLVYVRGSMFIESQAGVFRIDADTAIRIYPPGSNLGKKSWGDSSAVWYVDGTNVLRDGRHVFTLPARRQISSDMVDREGSVWLGTDAGGLQRLKPALFTTYSLAEGIAHPNVYATFIDRSGVVWAGTWGNGASRLDPATGQATSVGAGTLPVSVNSFYEDQSGAMWVAGGAGGGLFVCNGPTSPCRRDGSPELRGRDVFALFGDASGGVWAGADGLLFRNDGTGWKGFPAASGAPVATVRAFAMTRDGAVWMGTNGGGLTRYHAGRFTPVTRADGLPSDLIRSLYEDRDGWLWVGTEGRGLARLDPRRWANGRDTTTSGIVRIGARDGLFDEVIHQILEDDAGRLWMNTNRGIFWVARSELNEFADGRATRIHSTAYTERDGLRNREGNGGVQPAGAKGKDGRLWFPTQDGVVVVDPARVRRERQAPPLVVEQVVAGGVALNAQRDTIALGTNQRDLQIEYTALTFLEPTNVRFRYRLEPYDASWVDVGNRRTAFYTKVPPGRYTFRVQASDAAGGWYEPGAMLAFHVRPRFWETSLFRWTLLAALGAALFVAVRFREARLRERSLHLERVVDERTATLRDRERQLADRNAHQTRFFANVSHELRTPLTLTIGPLEDLRERAGGDPQVERWLDIALRNSRRLLRLVNQILDVSKLEAGAMHLEPRALDLTSFTRGLISAFAPVAERKGISLTMEAPDTLVGGFDPDAVEKIMTNLLSNAIKFTPGGGAVRVALAMEAASARLHVRDSGPGIPADHIGHVFERFYQVDESNTRAQPGTGIGLALVKELVELHGGTITVESTDAGTTFSATIPSLPTTDTTVDAQTAPESTVPSPQFLSARSQSPSVSSQPDETEDIPILLVVDDSADLRSYIRDHFAGRFRVIEAADGAEGIGLARTHLPDVVLSDVTMPGTDGNELVRALRASSETDFLSIILLTAQAESHQRVAGLEGGADDYIVKPFEMRELDVRVRNLVNARRRLRDRYSAQPDVVIGDGITPADRPYAEKVRATIREHLTDPSFSVAQLADAMAQDRSHLFRRIKQVFGESPSDLIRRTRLEESHRLLAGGAATVSEVAYAVGFNSLSHFCRRFQEVYGVTPATFRHTAVAPTAGKG